MVGFTENDTPYYYIKNLQGDVISIVDDTSTSIVTYHYDAWGNILSTETSTTESARIANLNPIRYRGYYYDTETELYYLNSRYYSAEMGRFLNADGTDALRAKPNIYNTNLFAYCDNNPVLRVDVGGNIWETIFDVVSLGISVKNVIDDPQNMSAWVGLTIDVACLIVPGLPSCGAIVGKINKLDNAADMLKTANGIDNSKGIVQSIKNQLSKKRIEIGRISGARANPGYLGIRYKTMSGPAYSLEIHGIHNGHTPHIQVNKWLYNYKGYKGTPYRFRSWHFEFLKFWKGIF